MIESTVGYTNKKFLITNEPVMELAINVLQILNETNKVTIKGKGELCPSAVSVANIITQNMLNGKTKAEQIFLDSEILDDGRLISTIEIMIAKINNQ
jgi:DNA-binding protein Alba